MANWPRRHLVNAESVTIEAQGYTWEMDGATFVRCLEAGGWTCDTSTYHERDYKRFLGVAPPVPIPDDVNDTHDLGMGYGDALEGLRYSPPERIGEAGSRRSVRRRTNMAEFRVYGTTDDQEQVVHVTDHHVAFEAAVEMLRNGAQSVDILDTETEQVDRMTYGTADT